MERENLHFLSGPQNSWVSCKTLLIQLLVYNQVLISISQAHIHTGAVREHKIQFSGQ